MTQMAVAVGAEDFSSVHAVRGVFFGFNVLFICWSEEAGPARAGVKFGVRGEEFAAALGAEIRAFFFVVEQFSGEGRFSFGITED